VIVVNAEKWCSPAASATRRLLPLFRLHRRHQRAHRQVDPRRRYPRRRRQAVERICRAGRWQEAARQPQGLQGPDIRTRRSRLSFRRRQLIEEQPERLIHGRAIFLPRDLKETALARRSLKPVHIQSSTTGPRLRDANARTPSRASGSSPARARRPSTAGARRLFRPAGAAHDPQPAARRPTLRQYDLTVTVAGGAFRQAARCATPRQALTYYEPELRAPLKKEGFLTRDSRVVERKKYGHAKAAAASSSRSAEARRETSSSERRLRPPFCWVRSRAA